MSSRTLMLSLISTLALGACAHDGSGPGDPSLFERLFLRTDDPVAETAGAPAPVHVGVTQSYGEPTAVPIGLVGPKAVASTDGPYLLDTGDRLRIIVFGQAELSNLYTVDQTGRLSVPLIGNVAVRGLTTKETEDQIASALRNGFLKTPQVTVEVETYRPFFVLGEVTQPGQYPYVLGMTAQTAVAIARGFTPRARQATVEITRIVNGELVRAEVPIHHPLRPGDTIQIFERWF